MTVASATCGVNAEADPEDAYAATDADAVTDADAATEADVGARGPGARYRGPLN